MLPTIKALVLLAGLSFSVSALSFLRLFFLSSCSHILVVYVDADRKELTTQESRTFHFSFLEKCLSTITPYMFLHAFATACILRRTSKFNRPLSDICPPRYTEFFTCLMYFPSNLMFNSSLCFPTHITYVLSRFVFWPCFLNNLITHGSVQLINW